MNNRSKGFSIALALGLFVFANPLLATMLGVTNGGASGSGELVSIDLTTGAGTLIGTLPETMTEGAYDTVNNRLYAQGSNGSFILYEIDPSNGAEISSVATTGAYNGMEFVGNTLYATMILGSGAPSELVTVDPATGVATVIGLTGYGPISGLAYSGTMYGMVAGNDADAGSLVTIDMATGVATMVGPTGFDKVGSIEFGNDGNLYGGLTSNDSSQPNGLILIDTSTGAGTVVGSTGYSISGLAESILPSQVVPGESIPTLSQWASITLVLLLGLIGFSRHRSRA